MRRTLLLVAALLAPALAGCIEEPAPAGGPGLGEDLLPPVPSPEPTQIPAPDYAKPLFAGKILFVPGRSPGAEELRVPQGAAGLAFWASLGAAVAGEAAVAVTLSNPDGHLAAECRDGECSSVVEAPEAGVWVLAWAGLASRSARVEVRLVPTLDEIPPVPSPVVPTPDERRDEEPHRMWLYNGTHDFAAPTYSARTHHSFAVPEGADSLLLKAAFMGEGPERNATVRLLDPTGAERARCTPHMGPCDAPTNGSVGTGVWRVEFDGSASWWSKAAVSALSAEPIKPFPNATILKETHVYPRVHPGNRTAGFWVPEGYPRLAFGVSYRLPSRDLGMPRVVVYDSSGAVRAICEVGGGECPNQITPEPAGLWKLLFVGPADAEADVSAFIFGGPPPSREPADPSAPAGPVSSGRFALQPGEVVLHRNKRALDGDRAVVVVDQDYRSLRLVVEANDSTIGGSVELEMPNGLNAGGCFTAACEVAVNGPMRGEWKILYSKDLHGEVFASVYATPRR